MAIVGIDTVAIVVSDRHKAIRWYRDVLGLDIAYIGPSEPHADDSVQGTPDWAGHWIEMGPLRPRSRVHLCEMKPPEPGPTGITFLTDDILSDYERMRANGAEFPEPPAEDGMGRVVESVRRSGWKRIRSQAADLGRRSAGLMRIRGPRAAAFP